MSDTSNLFVNAEGRPFVHGVFINLYHRFIREWAVTTRRRPQVHLEGTGVVIDNETGARFFQSEQRYPFDERELRKSTEKLGRHIVNELWKEITEMMRSHDLREGDRLFLLADAGTPVWITQINEGELAGCVQLNVRWTIALPDHLPFGLGGPKLLVPQVGEKPDLHEEIAQQQKDAAHALKEAQTDAENLFKIDLDAPMKKDLKSS